MSDRFAFNDRDTLLIVGHRDIDFVEHQTGNAKVQQNDSRFALKQQQASHIANQRRDRCLRQLKNDSHCRITDIAFVAQVHGQTQHDRGRQSCRPQYDSLGSAFSGDREESKRRGNGKQK